MRPCRTPSSFVPDALIFHEGTLKLKKLAWGPAAPRGLVARRRSGGPRPHGALTVCER